MIRAIFRRNEKEMLVAKVLKGIFKEAWREGQTPTSLLTRHKVARSRLWFEGIKDLSKRKKRFDKAANAG